MYSNGEKNTKSRSHLCSQKGGREGERGDKEGRETLRLYEMEREAGLRDEHRETYAIRKRGNSKQITI